jgi:glycosyltransferase involved in cell wall biosynthesis
MAEAIESGPRRPRIAIVFQGDATDPKAWSGIPAGISAGLAAAGAEPIPVDARMRGGRRIARALRMDWIAQTTNPLFAAAGGRRADAAIRAAGEVDAALIIGSGFSLRTGVPTATYDDMTVVQAMTQHGSEYEDVGARQARRWRERQRRNYGRARACCLASEWAAASVREDYGIDPAKVHVIGFGRNAEPQTVERDWSVPRFVFLGIDWERKQGQAVLDAFAAVRANHPGATLDLIGGHPAIEAAGVTAHGVLALDSAADQGRQAAILARSTCLVLPSKFEPFGIAYVDAGASGVPSIGTTSGGAATAVGDGGLLVDPADMQGLTEAMLRMCDPATARELGERAFAHAAGLSWEKVAQRLLSVLRLD